MTNQHHSLIRIKWIYLTVLIVGALGIGLLFSAKYFNVIKNRIGVLRYHGYPNISYFNTSIDYPLVTISSKKGGCWPVNHSCLQKRLYGKPGDTITVQVYFKNTSHLEAKGTVLSIIPRRISSTSVIFRGGVYALTGPAIIDSVFINTNRHYPITYIKNSCKLYFNKVVYNADSSHLFLRKGFLIDRVKPLEDGIILAQFTIDPK
jgi:hypothetical protein